MQTDSPVREYRTIIKDSGSPGYVNRLLVATPTTGVVRIEWVMARYGQVVPVNWSQVQLLQWIDSFVPLRYQVADAQNLVVKEVVEKDFEWLLLIEHDVVLPPDAFLRLDQYIREEEVPVVSGLYYTRSRPSDPLVFRGRGTGPYLDWEIGEKVWVDGVPTGILLVHAGILRKMYEDSPEYLIKVGPRGEIARRVFDTPRVQYFDAADPEGFVHSNVGTSDLDWCTRVMQGDYLRKAGWTKHADEHPEFPFLIDTEIFCRHININGEQFP